jgi:hypothetical protein
VALSGPALYLACVTFEPGPWVEQIEKVGLIASESGALSGHLLRLNRDQKDPQDGHLPFEACLRLPTRNNGRFDPNLDSMTMHLHRKKENLSNHAVTVR